MSPKEQEEQCCPPDCCDMRGLLSFQILWLLSRKPMNGQQIAQELAQRRGSKPTPGTIYPALKELANKGLIQPNRTGRQVVYKLTEEGKEGLVDARRYFIQVFGEIFEEEYGQVC